MPAGKRLIEFQRIQPTSLKAEKTKKPFYSLPGAS
jgi:hypothetical protein